MIKNLKSKLIICLFLLVTVFSVTSSCFAISNVTFADIDECIISLDKVNQCLTEKGYADVIGSKYVAFKVDNGSSYAINYYFFPNSNDTYFLEHKTTSNLVNMYNSSGTLIKPTCINLLFDSFYIKGADSVSNYYLYDDAFVNFRFSGTNGNILYHSDFTIKNSDGSIFYEPKISYVNVTHEFQSDTSAKVNFTLNNAPEGAYLQYSLTGVEPNADLTAPLKLRNPITYTPGVTNLIVKPNTKVYWMLYDLNGDVLDTNVYQVPEYDSVIENSDKSIEYSVTYNEDNTLATLTVNVVNGEFSDKLYYTENGMVSNDYAGKQLFPASKTLQIDHNCNMHIILYDPFDNLITAKYVTINKIGSIPEQNFKVDVTKGDKTVYVRPRLYNVLQSRFYSIEYDVILDTFTASKDIELHQDGVYVGKVTETSQTYACGSDSELKFYQSIGTSNITVTFRIINAETGETCITRTVSFKIGLDDESTGVTDSTTNGVTDNSFITSGAGSSYSDVSNMGINDYYNMVNTNNTVWSFFKVILNSLPNWITLPLSLLIFGVVTITLYRFIRGA